MIRPGYYYNYYIWKHFEDLIINLKYLIMKTRLISTILILLLSSTFIFAQRGRKRGPEVGLGVQGGLNVQTILGKNASGDPLDYRLDLDYHVGANISIPVALDFFFQPGLLYSLKGAKQDILEGVVRTVKLSYVEMPLNLLFKPQLGDGFLLIGLGPYIAYGIAGKEITESESSTSEVKVKFKNNAADEPTTYAYYRGLDAGGNLFLGYEINNGIYFQAEAQYGAIKINPSYNLATDKTLKRNLGFGFSLGYRF